MRVLVATMPGGRLHAHSIASACTHDDLFSVLRHLAHRPRFCVQFTARWLNNGCVPFFAFVQRGGLLQDEHVRLRGKDGAWAGALQHRFTVPWLDDPDVHFAAMPCVFDLVSWQRAESADQTYEWVHLHVAPRVGPLAALGSSPNVCLLRWLQRIDTRTVPKDNLARVVGMWRCTWARKCWQRAHGLPNAVRAAVKKGCVDSIDAAVDYDVRRTKDAFALQAVCSLAPAGCYCSPVSVSGVWGARQGTAGFNRGDPAADQQCAELDQYSQLWVSGIASMKKRGVAR